MPSASIDFWFSVGSTYTYLTVMRIAQVESEMNVSFNWCPFNVRKIMVDMDNIPFSTKPVKQDYMWRDIERRADVYGIPVSVPAPYPLQEFDLANKVAILGARDGWCPDYVLATYRRWFQDGLEPGSEPNLSDSLKEIGRDPDRVVQEATCDDIRQAYIEATNRARELNIFGAPTFVTGGEVFWGDDRLEDAVRWHQAHSH